MIITEVVKYYSSCKLNKMRKRYIRLVVSAKIPTKGKGTEQGLNWYKQQLPHEFIPTKFAGYGCRWKNCID